MLCLYRPGDTATSLDFLDQVFQAFSFPIRKLQTDWGTESSFISLFAVERHGIHHRYITPRRLDHATAPVALLAWERECNDVRF